MGVDQSRHQHFPAAIDHLCSLVTQQNVTLCADCDDFSFIDGNRARVKDFLILIHRQNNGILEDGW